MAKIIQLAKDLLKGGSKEDIYPKTIDSAVYITDSNGNVTSTNIKSAININHIIPIEYVLDNNTTKVQITDDTTFTDIANWYINGDTILLKNSTDSNEYYYLEQYLEGERCLFTNVTRNENVIVISTIFIIPSISKYPLFRSTEYVPMVISVSESASYSTDVDYDTLREVISYGGKAILKVVFTDTPTISFIADPAIIGPNYVAFEFKNPASTAIGLYLKSNSDHFRSYSSIQDIV